MKTRRCPNCGRTFRGERTFCPPCREADFDPAAPDAPTPDTYQPTVPGTAVDDPYKKQSGSNWTRRGILLALIAGTGGGLAYAAREIAAVVPDLTADEPPAVDPQPVDDGPAPGDFDRQRAEDLIHQRVNEVRDRSLTFDADLAEIARYHSQQMIAEDFIAHETPDGETPEDRYELFDYECRVPAGDGSYYTSGENIAQNWFDREVEGYGFVGSEAALADAIVDQWLTSDEHRETMLASHWDRQGIGAAIGQDGKVIVTQNFC